MMENRDMYQNTDINENADDIAPHKRLINGLDLRDVCSETGTVFEVTDEDDAEIKTEEKNLFDDESLINSLTLGAGNAVFDDDDSTDIDEDLDPFEKIKRKMEDMTGDGGVMKMIVRPGIGSDMPAGATVIYHYSSYLEYSDEPFDSSLLRNKASKMKVDKGDVLPGLNIAIKTMRKQEHARFLISEQYAYGKIGCPPRIPGEATILYEITIKDIVDAGASDLYEDLDEMQQQGASYKEKLKAAQSLNRKGSAHVAAMAWGQARDAYKRAVWIMEGARLSNDEEEMERASLLYKLYSNLAKVHLELNQPAAVCTQCKKALAVTGTPSKSILSKIYFRYGKAKSRLNDFSSAQKYLLIAQDLNPNNSTISQELEETVRKEQKCKARERFMCKKMFGTASKTPKSSNVQNKSQLDQNENESHVSTLDEGDIEENVVIPDIRPEFEETIEKKILEFCNNPKIRELPFPSNLSPDEIAVVVAAAKAKGCDIQQGYPGTNIFLKVIKKHGDIRKGLRAV